MTQISTNIKKYILQAYTGKDYYLTPEQHEKIMGQSSVGKLGGFWIEGDYLAFSQIKSITEITEEKKEYPKLPAVGMRGLISRMTSKQRLQALIKIWNKQIQERKDAGQSYENIQKLVDQANIRSRGLK